MYILHTFIHFAYIIKGKKRQFVDQPRNFRAIFQKVTQTDRLGNKITLIELECHMKHRSTYFHVIRSRFQCGNAVSKATSLLHGFSASDAITSFHQFVQLLLFMNLSNAARLARIKHFQSQMSFLFYILPVQTDIRQLKDVNLISTFSIASICNFYVHFLKEF